MIQETESQGWEGRLAPADWMAFNPSGGKSPFTTTSFSILIFSRNISASLVIED
jgi:hypothetical protein